MKRPPSRRNRIGGSEPAQERVNFRHSVKPQGNGTQSTSAPAHGRKRRSSDTTESSRQKARKFQSGQPPVVVQTTGPRSSQRPVRVLDKTTSGLLDEIKALGGDENDLELVGDLSSDLESETHGSSIADKHLQLEVKELAARLGLKDVAATPNLVDDRESAASGIATNAGRNVGKSASKASGKNADKKSDDAESAGTPAPPKTGGTTLFVPRPDWYATALPALPDDGNRVDTRYVGAAQSMRDFARLLLEKEAERYTARGQRSSSRAFFTSIMTSGTLSDKISALTLAIQESPVHNVKALETLFSIASKRSRSQALGALGAIVDLLGPGLLLPPERRLRTFQSQPGLLGCLQATSSYSWNATDPLPGALTEPQLVFWAYEDWLKGMVFRVVQILEVWCNDEVEHSRLRALEFVFGMLREKPEQEANLLRLLVSKVGDRERRVASRASYLLLQLQNSHPGMKPVIIHALEAEVLLRPTQSRRTKYTAVNTLNQTVLTSKDAQSADTLLRIYLDLFAALVREEGWAESALGAINPFPRSPPRARPMVQREKPSQHTTDTEMAERLVIAILTGINRAIPFASDGHAAVESHVDTIFRVAHSSNIGTSIQALQLLQQLSASRLVDLDRFYRTLYESLFDPKLSSSSKQTLYLNLLQRALKDDVDLRRVKAFVKRMLQIMTLHHPSFVCGLLGVIDSLSDNFPDLATLIKVPEDQAESIVAPFAGDRNSSESPAISEIRKGIYDGHSREPEGSNAHRTCLWEILPLQTHFHPYVANHSASLFSWEDGLRRWEPGAQSLIQFLDKFAYRSPKPATTDRGSSIMQPSHSGRDASRVRLPGRNLTSLNKPIDSVNSASFWARAAEEISAEDNFFYEYFQLAGKRKDQEMAASAASGSEFGDEEDIWKALADSRMPNADLEDEEDHNSMDSYETGALEGAEWSDDSDYEHEVADSTKPPVEPGARVGEGRARKRSFRDLPTFASAEDYAELLGEEEDM